MIFKYIENHLGLIFLYATKNILPLQIITTHSQHQRALLSMILAYGS